MNSDYSPLVLFLTSIDLGFSRYFNLQRYNEGRETSRHIFATRPTRTRQTQTTTTIIYQDATTTSLFSCTSKYVKTILQ